MVSMRLQQQRHGVCWGCVWPRGVRGTVGEVVPQAASTRKGNARSRRIGPSPTAPAVPVDPHHNRLPRCIFSVPHRCTIPNAHRGLVALARQTQTRRTTQTREREPLPPAIDDAVPRIPRLLRVCGCCCSASHIIGGCASHPRPAAVNTTTACGSPSL
jgi:hypothetical protein